MKDDVQGQENKFLDRLKISQFNTGGNTCRFVVDALPSGGTPYPALPQKEFHPSRTA
jgi:hypothetical protein